MIGSALPERSPGSMLSASSEKSERRRARILKEIVDTEVTYQRHLSLIVEFFEAPFIESGLIPPQIAVAIFGNIREISGVNAELLRDLRSRDVGAAFCRIAPFLRLYSTYANNHERALATLLEWEQKCAPLSVLRRSQEEHSEIGGLKLNALLITPVQRVPRYKLLLQDLVENTPRDHPDHSALKEATAEVSSVANHINEHIRRQDNFMRTLAIQRSLAGPSTPHLLQPGRIFIRDGILRKVSQKGGQIRDRRFYLFSDLLLYAKPRLLDATPGGATYACCAVLPLQHCGVKRVLGGGTSSGQQGALFTVTCKDVSLLLFSTQKNVDSWITAISDAICDLNERRQTLRKTSSANEPLRRAALVRWTRRQRSNDPLSSVGKRASDRTSWGPKHSCTPQSGGTSAERKRTGSDSGATTPTKRLNLGCLTPNRKRAKRASSCCAGRAQVAPDELSPVVYAPGPLPLSGGNSLPTSPWPNPITDEGVQTAGRTAGGGMVTPERRAGPCHSTPLSQCSTGWLPASPSSGLRTPKRPRFDWMGTPAAAARVLCSPVSPPINSPVVYGPSCSIQ